MKKSAIIHLYLIGSSAVIGIAVLFVFLFIAINGAEKLSSEFLLTAPKGFDHTGGGIFPAIIATLYLGGIAGITALTAALPVSLLLHFFVRNKGISIVIRFFVRALAAIPSIILGLFGYAVFVKYMQFGKSLIAGGLTLGIMIFPFLEQRIEKSIIAVDDTLVLSAYSVGLSKCSTIVHIVLPLIRGDILRALALYMSFAMGATAPIILTAAVLIAPVPVRLTDPVMALPYHLYLLVSEGIDIPAAYTTALVLLMLVVCINAIAVYLNRRKKNDMRYRS